MKLLFIDHSSRSFSFGMKRTETMIKVHARCEEITRERNGNEEKDQEQEEEEEEEY